MRLPNYFQIIVGVLSVAAFLFTFNVFTARAQVLDIEQVIDPVTTGFVYSDGNPFSKLIAKAVDLATDVTGTLPFTNGGTGVSSETAFNSLIRGLFSGTSPITYNSSTGAIGFTNPGYITGVAWGDITGTLSNQTDLQNALNAKQNTITAGTGLSFSGATLNSVWTASGNNIYNNNTANVGIGTTTPNTNLNVVRSGGGAYLPTSGTTTTGSIFSIRNSSVNNVLHAGLGGMSPFGAWIQVADQTNLGNTYPLLLNPNGGNVSIGNTAPGTALDVNGSIRSNANVISYNTGSEGGQLVLGWGGATPTGQANRTWNIDVDNNDVFRIFRVNSGGTALTPLTIASSTGAIGLPQLSDGCLQLASGVMTSTGVACGSGSGGVTSVGLSAPTGFSVSGSPVTTSGTLALAFAAGYEGFTTTLKNLINSALQPGDNVSELVNDAGYLTSIPGLQAVLDAGNSANNQAISLLDTGTGDLSEMNTFGFSVNDGAGLQTFQSSNSFNIRQSSNENIIVSDTINANRTQTLQNRSGVLAHLDQIPDVSGFLSTTTAAATYYPLSNPSGYTSNTGTVTSVGLTVPTGFSASGSPVTSSGTLGLSYAAGYQGYTSTEATKLSGIEAGADVTDATNVAAAGAVMTSGNQSISGTKTFTTLPVLNTLTGVVKAASGALSAGLVNLASEVTGTLPIANGGTGQTTANAALNALLPTQSGNSGRFLTTNGTNTSWATVSASPAGSNGQVQFNLSGAFGAVADFFWDNTNKFLNIPQLVMGTATTTRGYLGDQIVGNSRINTNDMYLYECVAPGGNLGSISINTARACGEYLFVESTNGTMDVGANNANTGGWVRLSSGGGSNNSGELHIFPLDGSSLVTQPIRYASSTPVIEAVAYSNGGGASMIKIDGGIGLGDQSVAEGCAITTWNSVGNVAYTNWNLVCKNGSTQSNVDLGVSRTTSSGFLRIRLEMDAVSARAYIQTPSTQLTLAGTIVAGASYDPQDWGNPRVAQIRTSSNGEFTLRSIRTWLYRPLNLNP